MPALPNPLSPAQVKQARALLAWSQRTLAEKAGIQKSTVADFERARTGADASATVDAIRAALQQAGIGFDGEELTLIGSAASSSQTALAGQPIRLIEASDLATWSPRRDAQADLPELISRLIRATAGLSGRLRFRSGDSIQQPGWDGICDVGAASEHIPGGSSGWELTTQTAEIRQKADEDYKKRVADPRDRDPQKTTFVFVVTRSWEQKHEWAEERRTERRWADVWALDADDLVHWLEVCPAVAAWLAVRMRKRDPALRDLDDSWEEWSTSTLPSMSTDLVLAGRDEETATVQSWVYGGPIGLTVQADSSDEAIAFLRAALEQLPHAYRRYYLSKCVVVRTSDAARALAESLTPLIVVLDVPETGVAGRLVRRGHHVYSAYGGPGVGRAQEDVVLLPHASSEAFASALSKMGLDRRLADRLARDSARSPSVLRRHIPAAATSEPAWARPADARPLIPLLLAGGWDEANDSDRLAIENLARQPYDAVVAQLVPWIGVPDSPLRKAGTAWRIASPIDAWFQISRNLTSSDLDTFTAVAVEVLRAPDPRFEVAPEERWLAAVRGEIPIYSALLRHGIAETVALLAIFGSHVRGVPGASARAEGIVRHLLDTADARTWWSLSRVLDVFAEATPEAFLAALDESLGQPDPPVMVLFREDSGPISGVAYHTELLWGLETLAGDPRYLGRVALLLARMARLDPGGRYINRPANSLRHILSLWIPQTSASLEQRLRVLDRLRTDEPDAAWELLLGLLPTEFEIGSYSHDPRWRDFAASRYEQLPQAEIVQGVTAVCERLLEDADLVAARWVNLVERLPHLPPRWRQRVVDDLARVATTIVDPAGRNDLWTSLRKTLHDHRAHAAAAWALSEDVLDQLERIYDAFQPTDPIERVAWLFQIAGLNLPRPTGRGWQADEDLAAQMRRDAVGRLLEGDGVEQVFALASAVNVPALAGVAIVEALTDEARLDAILDRVLQEPGSVKERLAVGMIDALRKRRGEDWVNAILDRAAREGWPPEVVVVRVLLILPASRATWDRAARLGEAVERLYWTRIGGMWLGNAPDERPIAVEKLLQAGRPHHAVIYLGHEPDGVPSSLLVRALTEAATVEPDQIRSSDVALFRHSVAQILRRLDAAGDVSEDEIGRLEWTYLSLLKFSGRPPAVLPKTMSRDPESFLAVVRAAFQSGPAGSGEAPADAEHRRAVARQAFDLLEEWHQVPGAAADGTIDGETLNAWVTSVRALCAGDTKLLGWAEMHIGQVLAHALPGPDGIWPPEPVRNLIKNVRSHIMERNIIVGVHNSRGVTSRAVDEGGAQERALASKYREWGEATALEWPRTTHMLEDLAKSFDDQAQREDEDADGTG